MLLPSDNVLDSYKEITLKLRFAENDPPEKAITRISPERVETYILAYSLFCSLCSGHW